MVSVILPSYNHGRYLRQCIDSVLAQTYEDWELIIVDDCSTDDSLDIARSYDDLRIAAHLNKENLGTYGTQNRALDLAKGDLIAVLNSDDYWAPEKLQRQVVLMAEHPECQFSYAAGVRVDAEGLIGGPLPIPNNQQPTTDNQQRTTNNEQPTDLLPELFELNRILASSLLFRRGAVRFDETLRYSGDWKALLDLARHGPAAFVDEPLTFYRLHGENTSLKLAGVFLEEIRLREAILADERIWFGQPPLRDDACAGRGQGVGKTQPPGRLSAKTRAGLSRCASALCALYVLVGDLKKARRAARLALRYDPANRTARRRLLASYLPKRLVQRRLWPGLDPGSFEPRYREG